MRTNRKKRLLSDLQELFVCMCRDISGAYGINTHEALSEFLPI